LELLGLRRALLLFNPTSPTEGRGDAKPLKSLGRSFKRRHYRNEHSREVSAAPGSDFRRRLSRKLELQLSKQEQLILLWLRITGQDNHPIVRRSPCFYCVSGHCLLVTLKQRLKTLAPGLTAMAVLEKLATMQPPPKITARSSRDLA
jgi:hypothetical protein